MAKKQMKVNPYIRGVFKDGNGTCVAQAPPYRSAHDARQVEKSARSEVVKMIEVKAFKVFKSNPRAFYVLVGTTENKIVSAPNSFKTYDEAIEWAKNNGYSVKE